ncbi:DUF6000 family protein [Chitinimonas sp.]|uniref:DUF6000 family protein n=1 Tax=Chitinimonas sp. TaxID=1934313 RepID=UPI002F9298AC
MNPMQRHSAGAIVVHNGPFSNLEVPVSESPLSAEARDLWVRPLYFGLHKEEAFQHLAERRSEITDELIADLLAQFDWRPRIVAGYLVAVTQQHSFTEQIGRLLLRSDVCYAGRGYCVALASLNTDEASNYLERYLGYYLTRPELYFDQGEALAALLYLDEQNKTERAAAHGAAWGNFTADKPHWNLQSCVKHFAETMSIIRFLQRK